MNPSIKLKVYAFALHIDRTQRDRLVDRADELTNKFAEHRDIAILAQGVSDGSDHINEARFICHCVDGVLRRRFRSPYRARAVIFTLLSARCAEIIRNRNVPAVSPPCASRSENGLDSEGSTNPAKILVVVCDPDLRESCASMIRSIPCEVTSAGDGLSALNELNRHDFDAILCEFFLPIIDGDVIYDELAASNPHLRDRLIFMTTLYTLSQPRVNAFRKQTKATFLIIPCSNNTLTGTVSEVLRTRAPSRENNEGAEPNTMATGTANISAKESCGYVTTRVIADLQAITDLLFGEESGLENLWEEICVQRQGDESEGWSTYEETVNTLIDAHLEDLSELEKRAIWLETDKGIDWQFEHDNEQGSEPPISEQDLVEYIAGRYIYSQADQFSNDRVAAFLSARESEG